MALVPASGGCSSLLTSAALVFRHPRQISFRNFLQRCLSALYSLGSLHEISCVFPFHLTALLKTGSRPLDQEHFVWCVEYPSDIFRACGPDPVETDKWFGTHEPGDLSTEQYFAKGFPVLLAGKAARQSYRASVVAGFEESNRSYSKTRQVDSSRSCGCPSVALSREVGIDRTREVTKGVPG